MASLFSVSLFDWWPFLRPDLRIDRRRAQPPSRLAAGHRRRRRAATLTVASTAPGWRGLGRERERATIGREPGLGRDGRMRKAPHHLVSGPGPKPGTQIFHARVKQGPEETGPIYEDGLVRP